MSSFDPIKPAPASDTFVFNFTDLIGSSGTINGVTWTCTVAPISLGVDSNPQSRILSSPIHDNYKTSAICGNMIDGVVYLLSVVATITDGRVLPMDGEVACLSSAPLPIPESAGVARFDYDAWLTSFPEFEGVNPEKIEALWSRASLMFRNDASSPVQDLPTRSILLGLLTAHIAQLFAGPGGASGMVGRINSKSVNGVSVSAEGFGAGGTQAWYLTTRYGADFWRATASYRTMHYVPGPRRYFGFGPFWR